LCLVAQNDSTTAAVQSVCDAARAHGAAAELIIYPPFTPKGSAGPAPGHLLFTPEGFQIWRNDVFAFLRKNLGGQSDVRVPIVAFFGGNRVVLDWVLGGLRDIGYIVDRDFHLEARLTEGSAEKEGQLAAEIVALRPTVAIATASAALELKRRTSDLPIVLTNTPAPLALRMSGGLMSYGGFGDARRVAQYVDRILKGAKPSELPADAPEPHWDLVINLNAAKQLGMTIPQTVLSEAAAIIR
jgi:hypothetical protein